MAKWQIVLEGDNESELEAAVQALKSSGWAFADEPGEAGFRIVRER